MGPFVKILHQRAALYVRYTSIGRWRRYNRVAQAESISGFIEACMHPSFIDTLIPIVIRVANKNTATDRRWCMHDTPVIHRHRTAIARIYSEGTNTSSRVHERINVLSLQRRFRGYYGYARTYVASGGGASARGNTFSLMKWPLQEHQISLLRRSRGTQHNTPKRFGYFESEFGRFGRFILVHRSLTLDGFSLYNGPPNRYTIDYMNAHYRKWLRYR